MNDDTASRRPPSDAVRHAAARLAGRLLADTDLRGAFKTAQADPKDPQGAVAALVTTATGITVRPDDVPAIARELRQTHELNAEANSALFSALAGNIWDEGRDEGT